MGKTVAFWSAEKEYGDTARMMASVASALGIIEENNVAVTALPGKPSEFLALFSIRIPEKIRSGKDSNAGFYPLLQKALFEKPSERTVEESGIRTINKGPLLFPWFDRDDSTMTEKSAVTLIMGVLRDYFDYVLIDMGYGSKADYSELLLKNADTVVVLLPQDIRRWREYFSGDFLSGTGEFIYVLPSYLKESNYTEGWFLHHFVNDKVKVIGITDSASFSDACMEGRVAELFLEAGKKKKGQDSQFFKDIDRLAKGVKGK